MLFCTNDSARLGMLFCTNVPIAERQIEQLLKVYDKIKVERCLQTKASDPEGKEKIKSYFQMDHVLKKLLNDSKAQQEH